MTRPHPFWCQDPCPWGEHRRVFRRGLALHPAAHQLDPGVELSRGPGSRAVPDDDTRVTLSGLDPEMTPRQAVNLAAALLLAAGAGSLDRALPARVRARLDPGRRR